MRIGYAEDLGVGDGGVLVKDVLDLDRIDVLAPRIAMSVAAADDVAMAFGVERARSPVWIQPSASIASRVFSGVVR